METTIITYLGIYVLLWLGLFLCLRYLMRKSKENMKEKEDRYFERLEEVLKRVKNDI